MASYVHHQQQMPPRSAQRQPAPGSQQRPPFVPAAPTGTFSPGTKIQVGSHRVVIQKYLSEGGFAHVYLVKMPQPVDGTDLAVLKRVAVPDKDSLRSMRTEVETMKRLKGHHPIVTYIDSHASEMRGGGYEVFLLMENCNGGGLIDFMNTRLQHRLTEPEILSIFADIAEGVACMHYLKPPLLHRDLKVENVLITSRGASKRFKLCDFGSAAPPRPAPTTVVECRLMDEDVQKHTTLQYRSPEMIDVYRKQPLNEKSDIWALGVLLYKLCYYTTPFEEQGQLAILNASFRFPSYPVFSDRIKKLIASMLRESIEARPNIYQVLKEACTMQGRQVPIYAGRPQTGPRNNNQTSTESKPQPKVGAVYSAPVREKPQEIPQVAPMRRGRPNPSHEASDTHGSPPKKVTGGDPFAALDSKDGAQLDADELSSRFPTLDQFSLLHDKGAKFDFDSAAVSPPTESGPGQRATETRAKQSSASLEKSSAEARASQGSRNAPAVLDRDRPNQGRNANYVSTGTMTSLESVESVSRRADKGRTESGTVPSQSHSAHIRRPSPSSRQSLDEARPPVPTAAAASSASQSRPRPQSSLLESNTAGFVRERDSPKAQTGSGRPLSRGSQVKSTSSPKPTARPDGNMSTSDLIDVNGTDSKPVQKSGGPSPSYTAPPPKKIVGKFEDAFKRFEGSGGQDTTPVAGSETRNDGGIDDDQATPEMRRELERRQLEEEEQRVAAAQAEYKKRVAGDGALGSRRAGNVARSATIQSRVQSLLEEEQRPSPVQRTAEGYGKYTDAAKGANKDKTLPTLRQKSPDGFQSKANAEPPSTSSTITTKPAISRPTAPKKPVHLNSTLPGARPPSPAKRSQPEFLMAQDLPGQPVLEMSAQEKEDYIKEFAKRFPSLNTVELEAMAASRDGADFADTFLFNAHASAIRCVAVSPPSAPVPGQRQKVLLASGSTDERINVYNLSAHPPRTNDNDVLAKVAPRPILESRKNRELGTLLHHASTITTLRFPTRSKLLSASEDSTIAVTRTRDWSVLSTIKAPVPKAQGRPSGDTAPLGATPSGVNDFAIHPSMKLMISVSKAERCMRLWNLVTGKKAGVLNFDKAMLQEIGEGRHSTGEGRRVVWGHADGADEFAVGFDRDIIVFGMDSVPKCRVMAATTTATTTKTAAAARTKIHKFTYVTIDNASEKSLLCVSTEDGRIIFFSTRSEDLSDPDPSHQGSTLRTARAVGQVGGRCSSSSSSSSSGTGVTGVTGRIKDFAVVRGEAADNDKINNDGIYLVGGGSDGKIWLWMVRLSELVPNGTLEGGQVGRLLGVYETHNRVTCLTAFMMIERPEGVEDSENEDEEDEEEGEEEEEDK
ncbi:hypothetical protein L249_2963 [Ophiocordyceps polyrhachis-furcata BCC 54312]|uniref:non-specific serine/threonine protein kinase n=1 Tax=Ophiocordyceps polyrhachis-furcata BCC 54312 TaxID=1330021 RepID=A0A367LQH9_9HYPO|nr:hypothetical protein L249_2963 [Ophiocordyceps polyrhachis-furcata BCC 54312]